MTTIYFVRHGLTEMNLNNRLQGWGNQGLSEEAIRELPYLKAFFQSIPLDAIYSSDLLRALQTAKPIAEASGLIIETTERLRERNFGDFEGLYVPSVAAKENWKDLIGQIAYPFTLDMPNGEAIPDFYNRVKDFLYDVIREHDGESIALVSHGMTIQMACIILEGIDYRTYPGRKLGNGSVTKAIVCHEAGHEIGSLQLEYYGNRSFVPTIK